MKTPPKKVRAKGSAADKSAPPPTSPPTASPRTELPMSPEFATAEKREEVRALRRQLKIVPGQWVRFDEDWAPTDGVGQVIFNEGGIIVARRPDGDCDAAPIDHVEAVWGEAPPIALGAIFKLRGDELVCEVTGFSDDGGIYYRDDQRGHGIANAKDVRPIKFGPRAPMSPPIATHAAPAPIADADPYLQAAALVRQSYHLTQKAELAWFTDGETQSRLFDLIAQHFQLIDTLSDASREYQTEKLMNRLPGVPKMRTVSEQVCTQLYGLSERIGKHGLGGLSFNYEDVQLAGRLIGEAAQLLDRVNISELEPIQASVKGKETRAKLE